jgi:hypothetical protein
MEAPTRLSTIATFAASVAVGCVAAIAIAGAAAVSEAAPSLRRPAAEVIRLEPVVVTVSRARYAAIRSDDATVARADEAKKPTPG